MSKVKEKVNKSLVLGESNQWFDNYLKICCNFNKSIDDENGLYLDVLKDLCNDNISDNIVIHLLSIIEQMSPLFKSLDEVEQTVGSLINIYSASTKSDGIRQKYLYTTTVIIICHYEMTDTNPSLGPLFESVIQLLIKNAQKPKTVIGLASVECLREIGNTTPKLLQNSYQRRQFKSDQTLILSSLLTNHNISDEDIKHIIKDLPNLQNFELHFVLSQLFIAIRSQQYQDIISPMIFKPYLTPFTMSCEIHSFHFALQLLMSFGLELFSTLEEQTLLKQLTIVATHPSLIIAHRLLALDYAKSIIRLLKPAFIESSSIEITSFDGPDTQEKKLTILNEMPIDNKDLLFCLKPLQSLSLRNNMRATNAFYRVLYAFISQRFDLIDDIEDLLVSVIFASPDPHIRRSIFLFNSCKVLAKGTSHKLIDNLHTFLENESFKNLTEFKEFLFAFEWVFKQKDLELTEEQNVYLLNLINNNCKRWLQSSSQALSCCTAVLYYQNISNSVKEVLLSILEWLMNERKNDLSITSLAQIYILALNTLQDDQNIKQVFNFDDDLCLNLEIIKECTEVPLIIKRITNVEHFSKITNLSETPFHLNLLFEIQISDKFSPEFDKLFAVVLFFDSLDGIIHEEYEIPILNRNEYKTVALELSSRIDRPFTLKISTNFNDLNGSNYKWDSSEYEKITLKDILLPVDIKIEEFNQLCDSVMKHKDAMQTVIGLQDYKDIEIFLSHFNWLSLFMIKNTNNFICALTPDRLLLGTIQIVNHFINLFLITNNYELLESLYYEFISLSKSNKQ